MNIQNKDVTFHTTNGDEFDKSVSYKKIIEQYCEARQNNGDKLDIISADMTKRNATCNNYEELARRLYASFDETIPTFGILERMRKLVDGIHPESVPEWAQKIVDNEQKIWESRIPSSWDELKVRIRKYNSIVISEQ